VLENLRAAGALAEEDYAAMSEGYALLRALDHHLRLIVGRSTRLPTGDHPALRDIARRLNYTSADALSDALAGQMARVRAAYDRVMSG
jgi:glutamine synthetase adenylyltransferase